MNRPKYTSVRGVAVLAIIFAAPNLFCLEINLVEGPEMMNKLDVGPASLPLPSPRLRKTGSSWSPLGYVITASP